MVSPRPSGRLGGIPLALKSFGTHLWKHKFHPYGWHIQRYRGSGVFPPFRIRRLDVAALDPFRDNLSRHLFQVDIESMVSRTGFAFSRGGWHPFSATLQQYVENESLRYEDSILFRFYERFRPSNVQEVFLGARDKALSPISTWPPLRPLYTNLWINDRREVDLMISKSSSRSRKPDIFVGPLTYEEGKQEFKRLCTVFDSITRNGYQPERQDQPIDGYFLEKEGEIRFIVLSGNHRVAALQTLGHERVAVGLRNRHPPIVSHGELHWWAPERGGLYTLETAQAVFDALWSGRGKRDIEHFAIA